MSVSCSLLKFMSIELVMLSNHLTLCCPLLLPSVFPSIRFFSTESALPIMTIAKVFGASASASVLPMNIQGWFPLGLTGLVSLLSKGLSRVFASTTLWKHTSVLSLVYDPTLLHEYWKNHSFDYMNLCQQFSYNIKKMRENSAIKFCYKYRDFTIVLSI